MVPEGAVQLASLLTRSGLQVTDDDEKRAILAGFSLVSSAPAPRLPLGAGLGGDRGVPSRVGGPSLMVPTLSPHSSSPEASPAPSDSTPGSCWVPSHCTSCTTVTLH